MDRLTRTGQDFENEFCSGCDCVYYGEPYGCNSPDGECESYHYFTQLADRLAEYEDTGLTPAEVAELAQAKADGRLVVLPVSVGDTVYRACGLNVIDWTIERIVIFTDEIIFIDDSDNDFKTGDIGKTVFLTRKDAEKALRDGDAE